MACKKHSGIIEKDMAVSTESTMIDLARIKLGNYAKDKRLVVVRSYNSSANLECQTTRILKQLGMAHMIAVCTSDPDFPNYLPRYHMHPEQYVIVPKGAHKVSFTLATACKGTQVSHLIIVDDNWELLSCKSGGSRRNLTRNQFLSVLDSAWTAMCEHSMSVWSIASHNNINFLKGSSPNTVANFICKNSLCYGPLTGFHITQQANVHAIYSSAREDVERTVQMKMLYLPIN